MPRPTTQVTPSVAFHTPTERKTLAYHEAGHAVMAVLQDIDVKSTTIEPNPVEGYKGKVEYAKGWMPKKSDTFGPTRDIDKPAMICMAGRIAEWTVRRRFWAPFDPMNDESGWGPPSDEWVVAKLA